MPKAEDRFSRVEAEMHQAYLRATGQARPPRLFLGTNALSAKPLFVPWEEFTQTHTLILGRSGVGKSKYIEHLCREIIKAGYGLAVLDGKGDLYENLLAYASNQHLDDRTILIDPTEDAWSVGINYLDLFGETRPDVLAEIVLEAIMRFYREEEETKPWLEEWGPASLAPLIEAKLTLLELFSFTSLAAPAFRQQILATGSSFYREKWSELRIFKPNEQAKILNAVRTRASRFWQSEILTRTFGQERTTIDWLGAMNGRKVVLANLGRHPKLAERTASLLGMALVHQIVLNAPRRPQGNRPPFFLVVDEFQKFVCSDFVDALDRLRGYGVYLMLAHQHLTQLEKESARLHDSALTNCRNKIAFSVSRKDAEEMAGELFAGFMDSHEIKDEIRQTKFRPVESRRTVRGTATTQSFGSGRGMGTVSGSMVGPEGDAFSSASSSEFASEFETESQHESESVVPWYEYEPFEEVTSRTYYTMEEIRERYIGWVSRQDDRHAQLQIGSRRPLPLVTPQVQEAKMRPQDIAAFKAKVFPKASRPTIEVLEEVRTRVEKLTGAPLEQLPRRIRE